MSAGKSRHIEVSVVPRTEVDDREWDAFIGRSPQGANYGKTWYLDAVWPGWQGIQVCYKGVLHAVMPLKVSAKFGISYCFQPPLSQYGGIFLKPLTGRTEKVYALKKRLVSAVVSAIPGKVRQFVINFAPEFDYPLPFYWAGYSLQTRYSYWLDHDADSDALFRNLNERTRTYISKARRSGLRVSTTEDVEPVIQLSRRHARYDFDYQVLRDLWEALRQNKAGVALEVRDETGRLHAGLIYQVSGGKQIHLFSAMDPDVSNLGGMSLAIWHSLEKAAPGIRIHDFEGSMLEPVEKFFRGFGTRPVPYLQITNDRFPGVIRRIFKGI